MRPDFSLGHLVGKIPKMPPKCFLVGFNLYLRCLPDSSKGFPDASQLPPYLRCAVNTLPLERPGKPVVHHHVLVPRHIVQIIIIIMTENNNALDHGQQLVQLISWCWNEAQLGSVLKNLIGREQMFLAITRSPPPLPEAVPSSLQPCFLFIGTCGACSNRCSYLLQGSLAEEHRTFRDTTIHASKKTTTSHLVAPFKLPTASTKPRPNTSFP